MIRKCKNISITDPVLVLQAVIDCLKSKRKRERGDTLQLTKQVLQCSRRYAARVLRERGDEFFKLSSIIANNIIANIKNKTVYIPDVKQRKKSDLPSGKTRIISLLTIHHFLYEYVVVYALDPLFRRVGEYQVSAIKGRGTGYGSKAIQKWLNSYRKKVYAVKLDIKDFYGSVDRKKLFNWLERHVANKPLLGLIRKLLCVIEKGIPIGSFLSQTMANIYLSELYHLAMERTGGAVHHALFYMDDMLLIGQNKRKMLKAVNMLIQKATRMGLKVKDAWNIWVVSKTNPIDMMGFRFSKGCTTIRKRIFVNIRRSLIRVFSLYKHGKKIPKKLYRRAAAYYGYFKNSDSCKVLHNILGEVKITDIFKYANEI